MNLNRRQFFKLAASGVVGAVVTQGLDLDKLLWVPSQKTYFLPAEKPVFVTVEWMTREIARVLKRNLKFAQAVNASYGHQYDMRVGNTVNIRVPQQFVVSHGQALLPQSIVDTRQSVVLTDQFSMAVQSLDGYPKARAIRDAELIGRKLAHAANAHNMDVFGTLPLPRAVGKACIAGDAEVAVRGVEVDGLTRFDILGGSTHEGQRQRQG